MRSARSSGSTAWRRGCSTCVAPAISACASRTCCASRSSCATSPSGDYSNPVVIRQSSADECYLSLQVVPYGDGQLLLLVSDVSRQMRLEAMRRDFVANASHELRSPLTVDLRLPRDSRRRIGSLDPELRGPVAEMRRQAERMTAIIRDLLELSRLEETDEVRRRRADRRRGARGAAAQGRAGARGASARGARAHRLGGAPPGR